VFARGAPVVVVTSPQDARLAPGPPPSCPYYAPLRALVFLFRKRHNCDCTHSPTQHYCFRHLKGRGHQGGPEDPPSPPLPLKTGSV